MLDGWEVYLLVEVEALVLIHSAFICAIEGLLGATLMIISHMGGPNQAVSGNDLETSLIMRKGRGIILAMVVVLRQLNLLILFIAYFVL